MIVRRSVDPTQNGRETAAGLKFSSRHGRPSYRCGAGVGDHGPELLGPDPLRVARRGLRRPGVRLRISCLSSRMRPTMRGRTGPSRSRSSETHLKGRVRPSLPLPTRACPHRRRARLVDTGYAGARLLLDKTGCHRAIATRHRRHTGGQGGGRCGRLVRRLPERLLPLPQSLAARRRARRAAPGVRIDGAPGEDALLSGAPLAAVPRSACCRRCRRSRPRVGPPATWSRLLLAILRTGSPIQQQELEDKVETVMRARG